MTHHAAARRNTAGGRVHRAKAPLTTGRLALWLTFYLILAFTVLGTVVALAGKGAGQ